ncbi:OmpW/AlkL family protein [Candidatus Skiveiella danica]|jgi:outer membrane protein|uniref:OmpW/AlkL family protein n=1 Tax=Candidatus Skiveiella danica TaxID=3386177 RepID=UPI0009C52190|nr:MAG: Outer membrane protein W precursor [Alphaproteobacteria bacterium ADurb.Bin100]
MKQTLKLSLVALALVAGSAAQAQSAGTWMARVGATGIYPQVSSGDLSPPAWPNTQTDVSSDWSLGGGITYMITDNWSVDLPLALPFTHTLTGAGAIAGVGTIGTTKALPATLFAQYRFGDAKAAFRPYLGAGLTYAYFYDENATNTLNALSGGTPSNPTTFSIESKFALSVQAGATYSFNERWFLDGVVGYTWLKNTTTLSTGQTQPMTLNPVSVAIAVGYRF